MSNNMELKKIIYKQNQLLEMYEKQLNENSGKIIELEKKVEEQEKRIKELENNDRKLEEIINNYVK